MIAAVLVDHAVASGIKFLTSRHDCNAFALLADIIFRKMTLIVFRVFIFILFVFFSSEISLICTNTLLSQAVMLRLCQEELNSSDQLLL
jgi:hypothetical protein